MSENFYKRWFIEFEGPNFQSVAEYYNETNPNVPLEMVLNLDRSNLKPFTSELLELSPKDPISTQLDNIRKGVIAYYQFQDLLAVKFPSIETENNLPLHSRHYAYFESMTYLKETVISLIDTNLLATQTLMRPFLELSTTYLYWDLRSMNKGYSAYYKWLKTGVGKVPFKNMLDYIVKELKVSTNIPESKCTQIQASLNSLYSSLSGYLHRPLPQDSTITLSGGNNGKSIYLFCCCMSMLETIIYNIIYLYIFVHPMILFPVEAYKKFGFDIPPGQYADKMNYGFLESFLGKGNIEKLKKQLQTHGLVIHLLERFKNSDELSNDTLEQSWDKLTERLEIDINAKDLTAKLLLYKAITRSHNWLINYQEKAETYEWINDDEYDRAHSIMKDWTD